MISKRCDMLITSENKDESDPAIHKSLREKERERPTKRTHPLSLSLTLRDRGSLSRSPSLSYVNQLRRFSCNSAFFSILAWRIVRHFRSSQYVISVTGHASITKRIHTSGFRSVRRTKVQKKFHLKKKIIFYVENFVHWNSFKSVSYLIVYWWLCSNVIR